VVIILFNQKRFFSSLHPHTTEESLVERPANTETTSAEVEA
jgi:signal peptidase II